MLRSLVAACLGAALMLAAGSAATEEKRVALVVGNAAYKSAPALPNPVNDATAIAASLERLGFKVRLVVDSSQDKLLAELDGFAADLPGAAAALFYYSGHGM